MNETKFGKTMATSRWVHEVGRRTGRTLYSKCQIRLPSWYSADPRHGGLYPKHEESGPTNCPRCLR